MSDACLECGHLNTHAGGCTQVGREALEREGWDQLLASYRAELSLGGWLACCDQPGPLHADDCPTLLERHAHGSHRE